MAELKKNQMNQILFVMVDGTDFASIKSTLGAASVACKFYGVNHGGSVAMTSGTISKAASLVHSGIFRQCLKATECNYDYVAYRFTATGCADQVMAFNMVTNDDSDIYSLLSDLQSDFQSRVPKAVATNSQLSDVASKVQSDLRSYMAGLSDQVSDCQSKLALIGTASNIASVVWITNTVGSDMVSKMGKLTSRVGKSAASFSMLSDLRSDFQSRVPKLVATNSQVSDLISDLDSDIRSYLAGISDGVSNLHRDLNSQFTWSSDMLSNMESNLLSLLNTTGIQLNASTMGDLRSAIVASGGGTGATASQVWAYATASDLTSKVTKVASRVTKEVAYKSLMSDLLSDIRSLLVGLSDQLSDMHSDMTSQLGLGATASDVASAVWAQHYAGHGLASSFGSLFRVAASNVSDIQSAIDSQFAWSSDALSDLLSTVGSQFARMSDYTSDIRSYLVGLSDQISDCQSKLANIGTASNIGSVVWTNATWSDVASKVVKLASRIGKSAASFSMLSDLRSDFQSRVTKAAATASGMTAYNSNLLSYLSSINSDMTSYLSDIHSDLASKVTGLSVSLDASDISDLAGQVIAGINVTGVALDSDTMSNLRSAIAEGGSAALTASDILDIASAVWANAIASDATSKINKLSSRVVKEVAYKSQLSDLASDLLSYMQGLSDMVSDVFEVASDAHSAATQTASKATVIKSNLQSCYSQLSDFRSDLDSFLTTTGVKVGPSSVSDIASAVLTSNRFANSVVVRIEDIWAAISNVDSALESAYSDLLSYLKGISDQVSNVDSALTSQYSNTQSVLSDLFSDVKSAVVKQTSDVKSAVTATYSDLLSHLSTLGSSLSDVQSDVQTVVGGMVNKQVIYKATGNVEIYNDAGSLLGTVVQAYTSTASDVTRKRLVP